jgi:divalent metal cation (Fe/Co/Zn/Cd) transporter
MARRIRAIAERNQIPAHNISVHEDHGEIQVELHLEVDDHLLLHQAHDLASHIEQDLRAEIPQIARINTHIESRGTGIGSGVDVTAEEGPLVERVRTITNAIAGRECCHDILVRRQGGRLAVSLHCSFDGNLPVIDAHRLSSRIEESLKKDNPAIDQVLVHTEPESQA